MRRSVFVALCALPLIAAAGPPAQPGILVTGTQHRHAVPLDLNRTTWFLSGEIVAGRPQEPRLMFDADMPAWAGLDSAIDGKGKHLDVRVVDRGRSPRSAKRVNEAIAVLLPRAYLDQARKTGFSLTVSGKTRQFPVTVSPEEIASFLGHFDAEAAKAAQAAPPVPAKHATVAAPALPSPKRDAPNPVQDARVASLGLDFVATPYGAMILEVQPGSIADTRGVSSGDVVKAVDGQSIVGLTLARMAARIGDPHARVLSLTGAGDVPIR